MVFNVKGQSLELVGGNIIAEGAVEFASFTLECDSSWDAFSKTVRFRHVSQETTYDVAGVVDGKVYYIPSEVLVRGSVFVSILGVSGTTRISTTELAGFFVEGTVDSGKTPEVTENAYAQYVDMVREKSLEVEESISVAEKSRDEAESFAKIAEDAAEDVKKSAESCRDYAEFCQKVSGDVSGAEVSMNSALEGVRDSVERLLSSEHSLSVSENERVAGENAREDNERMRAVAESEREKSEGAREDAENERIAAERGRVAGEVGRNAKITELQEQVSKIEKSLLFDANGIIGKMQSPVISIDDAVEKAPIKLGVSGNCVQESTPTHDNPVPVKAVGENGEICIEHRGKNLINYPYSFGEIRQNNGVTFEEQEDGGIRAYGKSTDKKAQITISFKGFKAPAGHYVISGGTTDCGVYVYSNATFEYIGRSREGGAEFVLNEETDLEVRLYIYAETAVDDVVYPMLHYYGTDDTYRKWDMREYSVSVPCELYSVKGICDRVILCDGENGAVIEKRIAKYTADGTESVRFVETSDGFNVFAIVKKDGKEVKVYNKYDGMGFCNYLPYSNSFEGECCWTTANEIFVKLPADKFPDMSSVMAFLGKCFAEGVPFETVYVLKTPEFFECSLGEEITLMKEVNILTADSGEIFLEYVKDTTSVYESIIDTLVSLDARVSLLEV